LDSLGKEMKMLRQKMELTNFYHSWIEEFENLKMEYVLIKAELLIYQKRSKRSQAEQWNSPRNKLVRLSERCLSPIKKMGGCMSCT
jgi:hypothetical protein